MKKSLITLLVVGALFVPAELPCEVMTTNHRRGGS